MLNQYLQTISGVSSFKMVGKSNRVNPYSRNTGSDENSLLTKCQFVGSGMVTGSVGTACIMVFVYYNFGYLFKGDDTTQPPAVIAHNMTHPKGLFNGTTQVDYTHTITQEYHVTQIIWNTTEVEKSLDFTMTTQSNNVRKKRDVLFKHKKFNLKTSVDQHSKRGL